MKIKLFILLWMVCVALVPRTTHASELRRYLLAVGANSGGSDREALKYAVSDAERFADIMVRMGGVDPVNRIIVREPDRVAVEDALADLARRVSLEATSEGRVEVLVYYSGHADDTGLRVGDDLLSYRDLRTRVEGVPAAVRITVLDACASGVITRLKGGEHRKPFLVDVSSATEGYAFLTSSSENEAAQESDVIGASFFTHYLVSGLRGAADVSGDGRVSLTEAYQFAFNETLARTTETMGGAQHPAYHINLSGTGDVVMTDVRRTSAGLVLAKELSGRFYVRDSDEHLVAELYKPRGRSVTLGLEAGTYHVHVDSSPELLVARVELGLDEILVLRPDHFEPTDRLPTTVRGDAGVWPPRPGFMGPLVGRHRIELTIGWHSAGLEDSDGQTGTVSASTSTANLLLGLGYSRWIREDLSVGLAVQFRQGEVEMDLGTPLSTQTQQLVSFSVDARKYLPRSALRKPYRPFILVGLGSLVGGKSTTETGINGVHVVNTTLGAFGAELGGGVDFMLGRRFMLGTKLSYNLLTDFPEPLAGKTNYSGASFGVSMSWLFGRGFEG
jgi:uncharacterized caspase-like protein